MNKSLANHWQVNH